MTHTLNESRILRLMSGILSSFSLEKTQIKQSMEFVSICVLSCEGIVKNFHLFHNGGFTGFTSTLTRREMKIRKEN